MVVELAVTTGFYKAAWLVCESVVMWAERLADELDDAMAFQQAALMATMLAF